MKQQLTPEALAAVLQSERLEDLGVSDIAKQFASEKGLPEAAPDGRWACDPRSGVMTVFNPARAKRPHDWAAKTPSESASTKPCPICEGKTTGVIDVRPLSEGFTFINKNLFPCFYLPSDKAAEQVLLQPFDRESSQEAHGLHFLQWTSSIHERDWHNMPTKDLAVVLKRMGALEKKLLTESKGKMPETTAFNPNHRTFGFVSIIKNYGAPVGGSLTHGHQQIIHGNLLPGAIFDDRSFLLRTGRSFLSFMQEVLSQELVVRDCKEALLTVPYFMKRPYQMLLLLKDPKKCFLHELTDEEYEAAAEGWAAAARAFVEIMPKMGRETAYNVLVHNGPSGGLYIEFLPYTQETGGYEQLGLYVCHETPESAAATLRTVANL